MPTAEPLPDNIRRIAVLVSSVDSATARQLLLHLPTSVAKQVRHALQNLGPVSSAERQRILTDFQSTAAKQNQNFASNQSSAMPVATSQTPSSLHSNTHSSQSMAFGTINNDSYQHSQPHASTLAAAAAPSLAEHSERGGSPLYSTTPVASTDGSQPSWKRMDIRALSHFLRAERATVVAVVINQLSPDTGVSLLQQLPAGTHREVLQAIANLQDIDEEAMQSIEEHLAERLKDYEQQVNTEAKGTRRVAALLAAAPPELQETWSRFVHLAIDPVDDTLSNIQTTGLQSDSADVAKDTHQTNSKVNATQPQSVEPAVVTSVAKATSVAKIELKSNVSTAGFDDRRPDDEPYILPFPGPNDPRPLSNTDRSLIQLEFEEILTLSTHQLAQVLTASDSQTVLLALAGASPSFMKRFYAMLTKPDAKALASRLSKIGPLKLRDIDEAQRSIAELAAKLVTPRSQRINHAQPLRVAA